MIPLANLALFAACGLALGLAARRWPRLGGRFAIFMLCFLAALELLLVVPGLYTLTYLLLACGIASAAARLVNAQTVRVCRGARRTFPWLLGVLLALLCFSFGREFYREQLRLGGSQCSWTSRGPECALDRAGYGGADALGLHGYHRDTSPNLVRLAAKGVRFDQASATAALDLAIACKHVYWTMASSAWRQPVQATRRAVSDARRAVWRGGVTSPAGLWPTRFSVIRTTVWLGALIITRTFRFHRSRCSRAGNLSERLLGFVDTARFKLAEVWGDRCGALPARARRSQRQSGRDS